VSFAPTGGSGHFARKRLKSIILWATYYLDDNFERNETERQQTTNTTYDKAIENAHKFDKAATVCLPLAKRGRGQKRDSLPDHDNNKKVKVKKHTYSYIRTGQSEKKTTTTTTSTTKIRARQQKRRTTLFRHFQTPDDAISVDVSTLQENVLCDVIVYGSCKELTD